MLIDQVDIYQRVTMFCGHSFIITITFLLTSLLFYALAMYNFSFSFDEATGHDTLQMYSCLTQNKFNLDCDVCVLDIVALDLLLPICQYSSKRLNKFHQIKLHKLYIKTK